jgi:hypothetical protein
MKKETLVWTVLFVAGGLFLLQRAAFTEHGMGKVYVIDEPVNPKVEDDQRIHFVESRPNPGNTKVVESRPRTVGLWLAAFFTLAIFSFLYRDNVFFKIAESIMVGVSAGWAMAGPGFWQTIIPKLMGNLAPSLMREWALPEIKADARPQLIYLIPLAMGVMLLWRLAPRGGWIARWPLAFIVGTFAGIKLTNYLDADFVNQIRSTMIPLVVFAQSGQVDFWGSVRNVGLIFGVLACLTYFFFSLEHRGIAGKVARIGVWYLMITFGASFAFTVMGRVALLASRISFLFDDWLWLIDPSGKRPPGW